MKLDKAVELLQGATFNMEENFWSELGGNVTAKYTLKVVDAKILIKDLYINLEDVTTEDDLFSDVSDSLYDIMKDGSDGVVNINK